MAFTEQINIFAQPSSANTSDATKWPHPPTILIPLILIEIISVTSIGSVEQK